ncbi:MAG TPA: hypothetical protein VF381_06205 [Thermoanaerobaculia bacterium]
MRIAIALAAFAIVAAIAAVLGKRQARRFPARAADPRRSLQTETAA